MGVGEIRPDALNKVIVAIVKDNTQLHMILFMEAVWEIYFALSTLRLA